LKTGLQFSAFGLLTRRERWALTWRGWLLLLLPLAVGVLWGGHRTVHPFLAVQRPLRGEVMVVEAWIPVYTLHLAAAEYTNASYQQLVLVRPLYEGEPGVVHGQYSAEYAATVLQRCGVPEAAIVTVLFPGAERDRTHHSALGFQRWLAEQGKSVASFDLVTLGPHARRSRLLYQRVFGRATRVGVIALPDPTYDARHWWRSSAGVREVWGETLAYLYARLAVWK
jgi:hypothetical protein